MLAFKFSPFIGATGKLLFLAVALFLMGCGQTLTAAIDNNLSLSPSSSSLLTGESIELKACWQGRFSKSNSSQIYFTSSGGVLTHKTKALSRININSLEQHSADADCSSVSFMSKQPGKYYIKATLAGHHTHARVNVVSSGDTVLNLLPSTANLGPDAQSASLEGFVTSSNGEPMVGMQVLFTFSSDDTYKAPVLMQTDKQGRAQLKFKPLRDTQVCLFLTKFREPDVQCSKVSKSYKQSSAQSEIHIERPYIAEILPLSVKYRIGHIYYLTLMGEGFEPGALAWVSNTPAEVVLATRYRLLIRFPGPEQVIRLDAGGEIIHILNPKSGYSVKKAGFNFSGEL